MVDVNFIQLPVEYLLLEFELTELFFILSFPSFKKDFPEQLKIFIIILL